MVLITPGISLAARVQSEGTSQGSLVEQDAIETTDSGTVAAGFFGAGVNCFVVRGMKADTLVLVIKALESRGAAPYDFTTEERNDIAEGFAEKLAYFSELG